MERELFDHRFIWTKSTVKQKIIHQNVHQFQIIRFLNQKVEVVAIFNSFEKSLGCDLSKTKTNSSMGCDSLSIIRNFFWLN